MKIKTLIVIILLNIFLVEAQARESNSTHTLSFGDDGHPTYRFMVKDLFGASFGYYSSDQTISNIDGQSYSRSYERFNYALRLNTNPEDLLRFFFQFELQNESITYQRSTRNDFESDTIKYLIGIEYKVSNHFAIEGLFGFGDTATYFETNDPTEVRKETVDYGPTTSLAISYIF